MRRQRTHWNITHTRFSSMKMPVNNERWSIRLSGVPRGDFTCSVRDLHDLIWMRRQTELKSSSDRVWMTLNGVTPKKPQAGFPEHFRLPLSANEPNSHSNWDGLNLIKFSPRRQPVSISAPFNNQKNVDWSFPLSDRPSAVTTTTFCLRHTLSKRIIKASTMLVAKGTLRLHFGRLAFAVFAVCPN